MKYIFALIPAFIKNYIKRLIGFEPPVSAHDQKLDQLRQERGEINTDLLGGSISAPNGYTFVQAYREIFEANNYRFETSNDSPVILDCGANIGLSVIYFKRQHPKAEIIAFEADEHIYQRLKDNLAAFNFSDIELRQEAVWTEDSELEFVLEGGLSGKILKVDDPKNPVTTTVRAVDINKYLDRKIDFLKLDIEGAEAEILKHIEPHLENVERIFLEYHSYSELHPQGLGEILQIFQRNQFRYQIKEAYVMDLPYIAHEHVRNQRIFDLQLDIFAYRVSESVKEK